MRSFTAVLLALTACGTDLNSRTQDPIGTDPDAGVDGTSTTNPVTDGRLPDGVDESTLTDCQAATLHSDLDWIQRKVFTASCLTGCHSGANPSSNMDLSTGRAWMSLVNVPSNQFSGWTRVVPGDPKQSMLMVQLGGESGPELEGTMPWNQPMLCPEKIDAIRRWITAGAAQ